ncbi:amidotransferase 1, exosortase A system-associated [Sphingomonas sp. NBWT7]|uniref:XrtA/PEP-CTERM system amidotransferase n=1 Tax=Sphingomonas sp. NBWT7 TaxID=2596913 RepID=UPI001624C094|nr:XrtA/PEP-CTERM system amidotransferase [Sphingomonas sp. NBWT7]QNE30722.1 amidotransferase 1, exosortase A system-associated [Sphingomonas sp. NBWT7]
MCGLAGLFHPETPKPVDPARIRAMTDAMAVRGPDGEGVWTAPGVGLGHRRLSIIDVAGSPQPMHDAGSALSVLFNGCIYNYQELRAELGAKGWAFRTAGDTEVLLAAWAAWGPAMLARLNGMFAFAIHDARTQQLFLARDRLGVKPLHYTRLADGALAFASELKGLLAHPLLRRVPDVRAVEDFLAFGYVPDDACIVAGVSKLPAGHYLLVERGKPVPAPVQWWDVSFADRARGSARALEEELVEHMRAAVRSRLVSDVPLGAFLSGGVDSSAVVALMAEATPHAIRTCTIGFDEAGHDERGYAAAVADRFRTDHRSRVVRSDDFALLDRLVAAFDEPFADASALATYQVCALAREKVTVALSGDGADEIFAGYRRYRFQAAEERVRGLVPDGLRSRVFGGLGAIYPKADWAPRPLRAKTTLLALADDGAEAYARSVGVTAPAIRARLFNDAGRRALAGHRAEDRYVAAMRDAPARDAIDRAQYADIKIWLPGDILAKTDRTSMAVSLEAREPLLDHRLVSFAGTLPASLRLRRGEGKWLMKKAMERYLPKDVLYRPKMGFVTPVSAWFRSALASEAAALSRSRTLADTGWFDLDALGALAEAHRAGRADHGRTLWQFVMLDRSLRRLFG